MLFELYYDNILQKTNGSNFMMILLTFTTIILVSNAIGILLSIIIDNAIVIEEIFTVTQIEFYLVPLPSDNMPLLS